MPFITYRNQPFTPQPYTQLAKVFCESGKEADAKKILIERENARRKYGGLSFSGKVWNWILGVTIGHGYNLSRLFYPVYFCLIFGWIFFLVGYYHGAMACVKVEPISGEANTTDNKTVASKPLGGQKFNSLIYSIDTFVPLVNLHQQDYWLPDATKRFGRILRMYLWFQIIMGWFCSTLAIAGIAGLVQK